MAKGEVAPRRAGFGSLTSLQGEIDRLFEDFMGGWGPRRGLWLDADGDEGFAMPKLDVAESDKAVHVSAELPGISEKDMSIEIADGVLTITGTHEEKSDEKDKQYHRVERSRRTYRRSLSLPPGIDEDNVDAKLKNGVLEVTLPKTAETEAKSRKIEVKAA